jgi:hypothetical protein
MSVGMMPGWTTLTVILRPPRSRATPFVTDGVNPRKNDGDVSGGPKSEEAWGAV